MDFRICRDGIERDGIERDPYLKLLLSSPHMLFALQSQPHLGTLLPLRRVWCLLVLSKNVGTYEPSFGSLCTVTFLAKRERVPANTIPTAGTGGWPDGSWRRRVEQHMRRAELQHLFVTASLLAKILVYRLARITEVVLQLFNARTSPKPACFNTSISCSAVKGVS